MPPHDSEPLSELAELLLSWSWSDREVWDRDRAPSGPEKTPVALGLCLRGGEAVGDSPQGEQPESGEGRNGDRGSAAEAWPIGGWYWWTGEASKAESISRKA